jgi:hypothetical protein
MNTVAHPRIECPAAEPWIPNRQDSFAASGTSLTQHPAAAGRAEVSTRSDHPVPLARSAKAPPPSEESLRTQVRPAKRLPTTRLIIPSKNKKKSSQPSTSRAPFPWAIERTSGRGTDRRELWSLSKTTPRAQRESSSSFRRISANAGPSRGRSPTTRLIIPSKNPFEKPT